MLEDLSAKQEKVNKLAKHLASIMGTQDTVSLVLLQRLYAVVFPIFALVANFDAQWM